MIQPVREFIDHLQQSHMSPHTVTAYTRDLNRLLLFIENSDDCDWKHLSVKHAQTFTTSLRRSGLSAHSIRRAVSAARSWYHYLLRQGSVSANPFETVRSPKAKHKLPGTLNVDEINGLLAQHDGDALSIRDYAILELFYSSGLRLSELASLNCDGVDLAQSEVRVTGKGNKQRIIPVGAKAITAVQEWLGCRKSLAASGERALFLNKNGGRLGVRGIQYRMNRWAQKHGLGRRLHPHMLRHSFASHVLASSGNLRAVQEMLGHANIATTQIYTHLDFQHLAKVYDQAHPRAHKGND